MCFSTRQAWNSMKQNIQKSGIEKRCVPLELQRKIQYPYWKVLKEKKKKKKKKTIMEYNNGCVSKGKKRFVSHMIFFQLFLWKHELVKKKTEKKWKNWLRICLKARKVRKNIILGEWQLSGIPWLLFCVELVCNKVSDIVINCYIYILLVPESCIPSRNPEERCLRSVIRTT